MRRKAPVDPAPPRTPPGGPGEAAWPRRLAALVAERLAYEIPEARLRAAVAPAVVAAARARGFDDPGRLVAQAAEDAAGEAWAALVDAVTVGETYFFRHAAQLAELADAAEDLFRRTGAPVHVWSAGCATGEEPYSVAMLLAERGIPCRVLATDVSAAALARAALASGYRDRSVGHLPEAMRERWLRRGPAGDWAIPEAARLGVRFLRHNLVSDPLPASERPGGGFDFILCRNVLIYFVPEAGHAVVARLLGALSRAGSLWLGAVDRLRALDLPAAGVRGAGKPAAAPAASRLPPPPAPLARSFRDLVAAAVARGLPATAGDLVEQRLRERPGDGEALVARGALALAAHDFEAAASALAAASSASPRPEGLDYLLGVLALKTGRHAEALGHFLEGLEDDPDDWASAYHAAALYRRAGRPLLEEVLLDRVRALLSGEAVVPPALGPAAAVVESVHRDPVLVRRLAGERLAALSARSGAASPRDPKGGE